MDAETSGVILAMRQNASAVVPVLITPMMISIGSAAAITLETDGSVAEPVTAIVVIVFGHISATSFLSLCKLRCHCANNDSTLPRYVMLAF